MILCYVNRLHLLLPLCLIARIAMFAVPHISFHKCRLLLVLSVLQGLHVFKWCYCSIQTGRPEFLAVAGEMAALPCNLSAPLADDAATMILWYREDLPNPIYTLDIRKVPVKKAKHHPSPEMEGRAYFDLSVHPPLLKIYPIRKEDQGDYKCRVDLRRSRTFIHYIRLQILVPPQVVITDEDGQTLQDIIGPFDEGSSVSLSCEASDGEPLPSLTWWKGSVLIDDIYNVTPQGVVRNEVVLTDLQRSDFMAEVTCRASNTNLTKPRTGVVMLDMNLRPLEVKISPRRKPISVGKVAQINCEARGARPKALITWWKEGKEVEGTTETLLEDGNLTMSTLAFTPKADDNGRTVTCRAVHPTLPGRPLEDTISLDVHFAPQLMLALGASNRHSGIKEGSDVYFECNIKSNPWVHEINWQMDNQTLTNNFSVGIIVNNQSLLIQNIGREHRGHYKCVATNTEGQGESDIVKLDVQYSPVCKYREPYILNVQQNEEVNITCDVESDPRPSAYHWSLNNTLKGIVDLKRRHPEAFRVLRYTPKNLADYGVVLCWGKNSAGVQREPCITHVIPEGEVTTDEIMLVASSTDEKEESKRNEDSAYLSPAVGVLVGVVVALVVMAAVIVFVMRFQGTPPPRKTYVEEEMLKYPSPIKKEPNDSLVDEKSPDIIPLPNDIEVYSTSVVVEMCPPSPKLSKQQPAEVYYTVESQTCV